MPLDNLLLYLINVNQFYKLTPISYIIKYEHPSSNNKMIMQSVTSAYKITIPKISHYSFQCDVDIEQFTEFRQKST